MRRACSARIVLVLCVVCVVGLIAAACGGFPLPSAPSLPNVAGNWSGSMSDNMAGSGTVFFMLAQTGGSVTGNWTSQFQNSSYNNGGTVSGTVTTTSLTATLTPGSPNACPFKVTGTISGSRIAGTYSAFNCSVPAAGTFDVTKQ